MKEQLRGDSLPRISIGIPIYYGEIYLKSTLDSILQQNYRNYEVIITDNDPGGEVEKIAEQYSSLHQNIYYYRHEINKGALDNWNSAINYARGEFFIYAGAHDLWSENLLSDLVQILDNNPDAVLAYPPSYWIDEQNKQTGGTTGFFDTSMLSDFFRFNLIFWTGQDAIYGLIRMSAVRRTRLHLFNVASDAVWLSELVIQGHFLVAPSCKRYRRRTRNELSREERILRYHKTLFPVKRRVLLPFWRIPWAFIFAAARSDTNVMKKIKLILSAMINSVLRYGADMALDVLDLFKRVTRTNFSN